MRDESQVEGRLRQVTEEFVLMDSGAYPRLNISSWKLCEGPRDTEQEDPS